MARVDFSGTHDATVYAVRDGRAEAGAVRSGTIERMAHEGAIDLAEYRVLRPPGDAHAHDAIGVLHSTRHYPEWPLARLAHVPMDLAEAVSAALMQMPAHSPAARAAQCAGWTIPHNYQPVHECLKGVRAAPYEGYGQVTFAAVVRQYGAWMAFIALLVAALLLLALRLRRAAAATRQANRDLTESTRRSEQFAVEARAASAAKSEFLANMSHKIRTPLAGGSGTRSRALGAEVMTSVHLAHVLVKGRVAPHQPLYGVHRPDRVVRVLPARPATSLRWNTALSRGSRSSTRLRRVVPWETGCTASTSPSTCHTAAHRRIPHARSVEIRTGRPPCGRLYSSRPLGNRRPTCPAI